jgi:DDE family transposase
LARLCGFVRRALRKLDLRGFVLSSMVLALQQACSLRQQAILAGICAAGTISKQALHKRLARPAALFLQGCLAATIGSRLSCKLACRPTAFGRLLVQDSTCISLPARLASLFPGPSNQSAKPQACLRIQCLYDLLTERFVHFTLCPFTRNDQAAAGDLEPLLQPRDMVLRDLGYFTTDSLRAIAAKAAFFLTRLRYGSPSFAPRALRRSIWPRCCVRTLLWIASCSWASARNSQCASWLFLCPQRSPQNADARRAPIATSACAIAKITSTSWAGTSS